MYVSNNSIAKWIVAPGATMAVLYAREAFYWVARHQTFLKKLYSFKKNIIGKQSGISGFEKI